MNGSSTITPQIFVLAGFLLIGIGIDLWGELDEFRKLRRTPTRRKGELVIAYRRVIKTFCWWMLPVSFFFRTGSVMLGFGNEVAGQVTFFALAGTNVAGVIFILVSRRYD